MKQLTFYYLMFLLITLTVAFTNNFISVNIFCILSIFLLVLFIISINKLKTKN